MAKNKNNGVIHSGSGDLVITDAVLGDPDGTDTTPATNNGVITSGSGNVVISGAVMGTGNKRR